MEPTTALIIAGGALLIVSLSALIVHRRRTARASEVRERFGGEFERRADDVGMTTATADLEASAALLDSADISRISPADREELTSEWNDLQHVFVDSPSEAVRRADIVLVRAMRLRNLPTGATDDRLAALADIDDDMAVRVARAHEVFVRLEADDGDDVTLDERREALLAYQDAFEAVLERPKSEAGIRVDRRPVERISVS